MYYFWDIINSLIFLLLQINPLQTDSIDENNNYMYTFKLAPETDSEAEQS